MPAVVRTVDALVRRGHLTFRAQVCGRSVGHVWEGWIEFASTDGSTICRSPRETTQPDRAALTYWAEGLSAVYLEGALARALEPPTSGGAQPDPPRPYFDGPAITSGPIPARDDAVAQGAVLDPFAVAAKSPSLLRQELGALRDWHLRNIIRAYRLAPESADLDGLTEGELADLIVDAVEAAAT